MTASSALGLKRVTLAAVLPEVGKDRSRETIATVQVTEDSVPAQSQIAVGVMKSAQMLGICSRQNPQDVLIDCIRDVKERGMNDSHWT